MDAAVPAASNKMSRLLSPGVDEGREAEFLSLFIH